MQNKTEILRHNKYVFSTFDKNDGKIHLFIEDIKAGDCDYPVFYPDSGTVGYDKPLRWPDYVKREICGWCRKHLLPKDAANKFRAILREARQYISKTELKFLKNYPDNTDTTKLLIRTINSLDWMGQTLEFQHKQTGLDAKLSIELQEAQQLLLDIHAELKYQHTKALLPAETFEKLMSELTDELQG